MEREAEYPREMTTADKKAGNIRPQWNFYKADYQSLYAMLASTDWGPLYEIDDLEQILGFFYATLNSIIDACVPRKKGSGIENRRYSYPEWYTSDIIRDIKIKARLIHKKYKQTKLSNDYEKYSKSRAKVKKMIATTHKQYLKKVQTQFTKDPKSFWQYIRSQRSAISKQNMTENGKQLTDEECSRQFADYFKSVYNSESPKLDAQAAAIAGANTSSARVQLDSLSLKEVAESLASLKPKRSAGPDGIPSFLFRDCSRVLIEPLQYIYNVCLKTATYPARWKTTRVIPIPKAKTGQDVSNYRPVAVLSTPAKVFESAIQRSVLAQVISQISDAQHGFRPGRSTATNLLNFMGQVVPAVDAGIQVDTAYLDFRKAFDTVDNDVLLHRLAEIGFTPHLLNFFVNYMRDRQQYVDYNGYESDPYYTRSGVSQGSNLGPLNFIIMINSLPEVITNGTCLLFADDLKLLLEIKDESDCKRMQDDIDRIVEWSKVNKLNFNVSKCKVISFTRARKSIQYEYKMDKEPIQRALQVRDLGVYLTPELTFREHVTNVCKMAYRNLGFVLRQARGFTNITAVKVLYDALVRSHLEYSAIIWAPHEAKYMMMLERVQNKFMRHLYHRLYGVYPFYPLMYPTLFVLGMVGYNELRVRREFALVYYLIRLLRGKEANPGVLGRLYLAVPDRYVCRRRRPPLLAVPRARTNLLAKAPLTRAIGTINGVHDKVDIFAASKSDLATCILFVTSYNM